MAYEVQIASFEGPLDLLLQLVEAQKLEITEISLVEVTDPFVAHVRAHQGELTPQELADFLYVAAKLVYLKSKALVPTAIDPLLEEGPDLATQLKLYQVFVQAANQLGTLARANQDSWSRMKPYVAPAKQAFLPPQGIGALELSQLFHTVVRRLEPLARLPRVAIERVMSLEEKMTHLGARLARLHRFSFHAFLAESDSRLDIAVGFLALLELIKQRVVRVEQPELFSEIHLHSTDT